LKSGKGGKGRKRGLKGTSYLLRTRKDREVQNKANKKMKNYDTNTQKTPEENKQQTRNNTHTEEVNCQNKRGTEKENYHGTRVKKYLAQTSRRGADPRMSRSRKRVKVKRPKNRQGEGWGIAPLGHVVEKEGKKKKVTKTRSKETHGLKSGWDLQKKCWGGKEGGKMLSPTLKKGQKGKNQRKKKRLKEKMEKGTNYERKKVSRVKTRRKARSAGAVSFSREYGRFLKNRGKRQREDKGNRLKKIF